MAIDIKLIKQLRDQTSAGVSDCREALEEAGGNMDKAKDILKAKGLKKAAKKSEREIKAGLVYSYVHGGRIGSLIEIGCETDFVAKTEDFQNLCKEVAMQVASMAPENVEELLNQAYIRDSKKNIKDLLTEVIAKLGENCEIRRFVRYELGQ